MSYQEKRSLVSILTGVIIMLGYVIYAYGQYQAGALTPDDLRQWATTMLVFIGIGVLLTIIVQILLPMYLSIFRAIQLSASGGKCSDQEITRAINLEMITDEMDRLIELKSMRVGFIVAGIGFVSGLITLVAGFPSALMLNIMFGSFYTGSLLEGFMQLYYYRKGIHNG